MIKTINKNRFKTLASALLKENIIVEFQVDWSMTTTSGDYGYTDQPRLGTGAYNGIEGWYFTRNCNDNFTDQPKIINGASDLLVNIFGDKGRHSRFAVGSNALPLNISVEIDAIIKIK